MDYSTIELLAVKHSESNPINLSQLKWDGLVSSMDCSEVFRVSNLPRVVFPLPVSLVPSCYMEWEEIYNSFRFEDCTAFERNLLWTEISQYVGIKILVLLSE